MAISDAADLADECLNECIQKAFNYPEDKSSSMYVDYQYKGTLVLDAKNGFISGFGRIHNDSTPHNDNFIKMFGNDN